jgi:amino acid adenylation domain-containing protein/thioester reductase-like protein
MPIADEPHFTVPQSPASDSRENAYFVTRNDVGQYAIWPAGRPVPAGWHVRSAPMSQGACRALVARAWPDIRPARPGAEGYAESAGGAGPAGLLVPEWFMGQARRNPGAVALRTVTGRGAGSHGAGSRGVAHELTYGELGRSASQVAHALRDLGAGPGTVVGSGLERGPDAICVLLGILFAGAAYLPMDPLLPAPRLARMAAAAGATVVVTDRAAEKAFAETGARLVFAGELSLDRYPGTPPAVSLPPESTAYVISTSGSTGEPKAVAVSHGSLGPVLADLVAAYRLSGRDRVLQLAPLSTDTSLEQIFVSLLSGAALVLPPPGPVAPSDLLALIAAEQVTTADLTPAYWHQLLARAGRPDPRLDSLRLMITGGDRADPADGRAARQAAPGARLINAYGLTETTITSVLGEVAAGDLAGGPVPVGRPLGHAQVLVLGPDLDPVPAGETGEIHIGGGGVALGYLGDPDRTAERFLPNPYGSRPGARMYRTGDLGRWASGGHLEVLGRIDRQVKVRGYRVDPVEVEQVLAACPGVADAAVAGQETSPGVRQLVGYVVAGPGAEPGAGPAAWREFLGGQLPGYMIPDVFVEVAAIPRAPTGAPEVGPWPGPAAAGGGADGGGGELTPAQAGMAHLWARALGVPVTGLDDDFFALGGDSLKAAEMMAQARTIFGIGPDHVRGLTRSLLRDPTLGGFSGAVQAARAGFGPGAGAGVAAGPDVAREAALDVPVLTGQGPAPDWRRPRQVLLTGATGFLGVHLLHELLSDPRARVHCLVRARDAGHARDRIAAAARRYGLGPLDLRRVAPLAGDLAQPGLGLSPVVFAELARTLDVIHHPGAQVNFIYPYEELRAANVGGTRELIRLAGTGRGIPLHYVSTTAVLAGLGATGVRSVTEDTPLGAADELGLGYVETKYVAEELLRNAARAGLPVTIYRPLDVAGHHRTGAWNTATELCALIRFMADSGLAPDIDLPLDLVPADLCAAAIRHIATHQEAAGHTYHLASPRPAGLTALAERLRAHGFPVMPIPYRAWVEELLRRAVRDPAHPMAPFVPLFVDQCGPAGLTVAETYLGHVFPAYTRDRAEQALDGSGIVFPPVGAALLDLHLERLIADGYLGGGGLWRPAGTRTGTRSGSTPRPSTARWRSAPT